MKNKRRIHLSLLAVLLGLAGWWLWHVNHVRGGSFISAQSATPATITQNSVAPRQSSTTSSQASADPSQYDPELTPKQKARLQADPSAAARYAKFAQAKFELNSTPIEVYGKVVDQYGQPIVEADVKGGTLIAVSPIASAGEKFITKTDAQGRFQFTGLHGMRFGLSVEKVGYEYNSKLFLGWWDHYRPDPNDPVVFVLWKLRGAEPMVHARTNNGVPYDGRTVSFDLLTGKASDVGDLRVTLLRVPLQIKSGIDHFEWNVSMEVAGGGLVEAREPYPYFAPESGYRSTFSFGQAKDAPKWIPELAQTFYVRLAGGQYGRVYIRLTTDYDQPETGMRIESWINPSGSRNLEFDPKKTIKVPPSGRL